MSDFTHTLTSLAAWGGPVNAGSGCLSCLTHCLRGKVVWFARENATLWEDAVCSDDEAEMYECVTVSTNYEQGGFEYDRAGPTWPREYGEGRYSHVMGQIVTRAEPGGPTVTTYFGAASLEALFAFSTDPETEPVETGFYYSFLDSTRNEITGEWEGESYSIEKSIFEPEPYPPVPSVPPSPYNIGDHDEGFPYFTVDRSYCPVHPLQSEEDADAEIEAARNSTAIWGAGADAQFPPQWCYGSGTSPGSWWGWNLFSADPLSPLYLREPGPASPLLVHTIYGRDVLRGKLAVPEASFPGQEYIVTWDEVVRRLGYGVSRSGSVRGRTLTSRTRTLSLSGPQAHPDDALGSTDYADASWSNFGWTVTPMPSGPSPSVTGGFHAASLLRRSRVRFALRRPGAFTFRVRRVEYLSADPANVAAHITTFANFTTTGTVGADGLNATSVVETTPSDRLRTVSLWVEWVRDADEFPVLGWLAIAMVRDGWLGFRQLDHEELLADSQFYRLMSFEQVSVITATYIPDPENPPSEEEGACGASKVEDLSGFSQTQSWSRSRAADGSEGPWALISAIGNAGAANWSGEVAPFDPPAVSWSGGTVSATSRAITETTPEDPTELNDAQWWIFRRVTPTTNPYFGGVVLAVHHRNSATTPQTYTGDESVRESGLIYLHASAPETSTQIVNVHVTGV